MQITGHKTRRAFDRYHIVSPGDVQGRPGGFAGIAAEHSRRIRLTGAT